MPEVVDIFRRYGEDYLETFAASLLPSHRRAMQDILRCRTPDLGGHVYRCDHCGREHYVYHSCRNRSCPQCHGAATDAWLAARREELLPGEYFHLIFTLPAAWRDIVRRHQKVLYGALMKAAAQALQTLAADPKYVGGQIGILAVLHTWGRTLTYHPHVHCLVPGGGLTDEDQWRAARKGYLVPVRALSKIFRGLFRQMAAARLPGVALPKAAREPSWVVYCKPSVQGAEKTLAYLGRYVHRVAISNRRIVSIDHGRVCFRYQKSGSRQWKTMTLGAQEFLRRFLQHVLPKGVHKVRYYGLWAPTNRPRLHRIQLALLADRPPTPSERSFVDLASCSAVSGPHAPARAIRCPHCSNGMLVFLRRLPRRRRAPP